MVIGGVVRVGDVLRGRGGIRQVEDEDVVVGGRVVPLREGDLAAVRRPGWVPVLSRARRGVDQRWAPRADAAEYRAQVEPGGGVRRRVSPAREDDPPVGPG